MGAEGRVKLCDRRAVTEKKLSCGAHPSPLRPAFFYLQFCAGRWRAEQCDAAFLHAREGIRRMRARVTRPSTAALSAHPIRSPPGKPGERTLHVRPV